MSMVGLGCRHMLVTVLLCKGHNYNVHHLVYASNQKLDESAITWSTGCGDIMMKLKDDH